MTVVEITSSIVSKIPVMSVTYTMESLGIIYYDFVILFYDTEGCGVRRKVSGSLHLGATSEALSIGN